MKAGHYKVSIVARTYLLDYLKGTRDEEAFFGGQWPN
jgi:hypothetical protein